MPRRAARPDRHPRIGDVARMLEDVANLAGRQAQVHRVQHCAGAGHSEVELKVPLPIPGQRPDAITGLHRECVQRVRQPVHPLGERGIANPVSQPGRPGPAEHRALRVQQGGPVEQPGDSELVGIHQCTASGPDWDILPGDRTWGCHCAAARKASCSRRGAPGHAQSMLTTMSSTPLSRRAGTRFTMRCAAPLPRSTTRLPPSRVTALASCAASIASAFWKANQPSPRPAARRRAALLMPPTSTGSR